MSIYAGIPSGAYNSEAAMLYGGLAPADFNDNAVYNFLIPWFTRNNVNPGTASAIAHIASEYLKAAADFRLNRDGTALAMFWREFMKLEAETRDLVRRAVNYLRHKKRIPLGTTSNFLAQATTWDEALPYLRAVPGISKKFPRPLLHWMGMSPEARDTQRHLWRRYVPQVRSMDLPTPPLAQFIDPTPEQIEALARRKKIADAVAAERRRITQLTPPVVYPKKEVPPELRALREAAKQRKLARELAALQDVIPGITAEALNREY